MALGILGATLKEAGVSARCVHANIDFAGIVGLDDYDRVVSHFSGLQFAELTFTEAAFREEAPRYQGYLGTITQLQAKADRRARVAVPQLFHRFRHAASEFVDTLAHRILSSGARIVGCSSMFEQHVPSLALLRRLKELDPEIITMIGGPNVEGPMGQATVDEFRWVDYAVSGEADDLIAPLCKRLLQAPKPRRVELAAGVLRRQPLPRAQEEHPRVVLPAMDSVATPDFDDYFEDLGRAGFRDRVVVGLTVETSRGCWYGEKKHCTFCGQNGMGMTFRSKAPDKVLAEFRGLAQRYGNANFGVVDNILDLSYFDTVLPELERDDTRYRIFYELKPNMKRAHLVQLWRSGVRSVIPGFESLDDEPLKLMRKGTSAAINVQVLKWATELGIYVHWIMLHGVPGESDASYERMTALIPKLVHLQPANLSTPIEFHRFSPYVDESQRFALELTPHPAYEALYPVGPEARRQLAYYFVDTSDGQHNRLSAARRSMLDSLTQWHCAHFEHQASLTISPGDNGSATIHDTRPCREEASIELSADEHDVYRAMDTATTERSLIEKSAADPQFVRAALARFDALAVAIHISGRWLALATAGRRPIEWLDYKAPHGAILPKRPAQRQPAAQRASEKTC